MIQIQNLSKSYPTRHGGVDVLRDVNLTVSPGEKLGIVGPNGAGKSTLFRLMSGVEQPTGGEIVRTMSVSWPLAFTGAFQATLTGIDNVKFICRVYDVPFENVIGFVEDFSELGRFLREPVKVYSSGMRARLAFAVSMMVEFDCYLIDEVAAVGDSRFQKKCQVELFEKRSDRALVIVSHDPYYLREHCTRGSVLSGGTLRNFNDLEKAFEFYTLQMAA